MSAHVTSVHIGLPRDEEWAGNLRRTAIDKRSVTEPVDVRTLGIVGDQVADTKHHGGIHRAVYAFAQEDLDVWTERLGDTVAPGTFGENLTTSGIDVNGALLGERWRIGTVLLEVVDIRIPCRVFKNWMGLRGFDDTAWVRRFTEEGRPGACFRVLEEGSLRAGDPISVEHRPGHDVDISMMFRALTTDRSLLPRLLEIEGLAPWVYDTAEKYVATLADR